MEKNTVFSLFFFVTLFTCLAAAIVNNHHILLPSHLHQDNSLSSSSTCTAPDPNLFQRPVIGILSNPGDGSSGRLSNSSGVSHIAASYVKFVESGGARVIPLLYNESQYSLYTKLSLTNGLLLTGGSTSSGPYLEALQFLFEEDDVLEPFNASSLPSSLQLESNALAVGSLYERFPSDLLRLLMSECLVLHNHIPKTEMARFLSPQHVLGTILSLLTYGTQSEARRSSNRPDEQAVRDNLIYNYKASYGGVAGKGYDQVYLFE
ncbi:hypothetical protein V8G54_025592 [Vigna mungo]|uniref:folate gamma-glutamyl hydrolase n=1 Tax=Vigna mungo TaxID=3915 RepID=A0AAQ3RNH8_VIGMU